VLLLEIYATEPSSLPFPKVVAGLPLGVPWFGALGALGVSLSALSFHRRLGPRMVVLARLTSADGCRGRQHQRARVPRRHPRRAAEPQTGSPIASTKILYYVIAFVVGYREASFRELLNNVTDIILWSSGARQPTSVTGRAPDSGPAGTEVTIYGNGLGAVNSVTFDGISATIKSAADSKLLVDAPDHNDGEVPLVVRTRDASFGGYKFVYNSAPGSH
jgi:hypothetical protein